MANQTDPFVEIDLGDAGFIKHRNMAESKAWVEDEREFWSWLNSNEFEHFNWDDGSFSDISNNLHLAGNQIVDLESEPENDQAKSQLVNNLTRYARTGLQSETALAQYLHNLRENEGSYVAAAALASHLGGRINFEKQPKNIRNKIFQGAVALALFDAGVTKRAATAVSGASKLATKNIKEFMQKETELNEGARSALSELHAEVFSDIKAAKSQTKTHWRNLLKTSKSNIDDAIASMRATENAYKEFMKLGASEGYWAEKAVEHDEKISTLQTNLLRFAKRGGGGLVVVIGIAFIIAAISVENLDKFPTALFALLAAFIGISSTIVFWIGRVLVRLYLSERHLAHDARERVIMSRTYNALIAEEKIDVQERQVVLQALFRSASDGIVKEDGAPDFSIGGRLAKALDPK